jgi:hypothetical protein
MQETKKTGQAIFHPIINQGDITFPNSNNNVIYADIKKERISLGFIICIYNRLKFRQM